WATKNIGVLGDQGTSLINFVIANFHPTAIVTLNAASLVQSYDGVLKPVTATTIPQGLTVNVTYNGSFIPPAAVGVYNVVATIIDPNYTGTASGTLTIAKAMPVITWATPAPVVNGTALSNTQL